MKRIWIFFRFCVEKLSLVTGFASAIAILAAAIIVTEGVITRKVFGMSAIWQIEASVFLLIFATLCGSAFIQKNEHHLNVDFVLVYLSPKTREIFIVIVSIITLFIAGFFAVTSIPMWWEAWINDQHTMSLWGPPLWIPYFFVPFGMLLLFLQYIVYIADKINSLLTGEYLQEFTRAELKEVDLDASKLQGEEGSSK